MKLNKFLVLTLPVAVLMLFEVFFFYPKVFYLALFLSILFIIAVVKSFAGKDFFSKRFYNFTILPVLFLLSSAVYSLIITNRSFIQVLILMNVIFIYFYFKNLFYLLVYLDHEKEEYFKITSLYISILIIFFSASAIYALQSFLNLSILLLILGIIPIIGLSIYNIIWFNIPEIKIKSIYVLISCMVLVETSWALSFLPLNYSILGLILTLCYYMLSGLIKIYLEEKLTRKSIKPYLSFGLIGILIVFLTAKWM